MLKLAIAVMPVLLSACLGDIPPDPTPAPVTGATARALFDGNVYAILDSKCAGCHATRTDIVQFVDLDPAGAYDKIVGIPAAIGDFAPAETPLLTKIAGGHESLTYSTDQLGKITSWLEQEVSERGPTPPPGLPTLPTPSQSLVRTWSGCLTLGDFRVADMARAWGDLHTDDNSTCANCHTNGGYGMVASDYEPTFFNLITKHSGYLLQYFYADATDPQHPAMAINTFSVTQVSQALDPHLEHPTFDPGQGMAALQTFFAAATARLAAGQCGAPTLVD